MNPRTLMLQSATKIPYDIVSTIPPHKKRVIHRELRPFITGIGTSASRNRMLDSWCDCEIDGECLCYFKTIKQEAISMWWAAEENYQILGNWCHFH